MTDRIPSYRGSELDTFVACPFAYGSGLQHRLLQDVTEADLADALGMYCCPEGVGYIAQKCGRVPFPARPWAREVGRRFHEFMHAYGLHLKREGLRTDWERARALAQTLCNVDGHTVPDLRTMMLAWSELWEFDPAEEGAVELTAGSFEAGQAVRLPTSRGDIEYVFHPDYARLSQDLAVLDVWDWKSGLAAETYHPHFPNKQLLRYALGFCRMYPTIQLCLLHLHFVNPQHPLHEEPLTWQVDVANKPIEPSLITDVAETIRLTPEFPPQPGWLCPFCDWVTACPAADQVHALCSPLPQDAREAYGRWQETYLLSALLNTARSALKKIVDIHVTNHGPLDIGDGQFYGPRAKLKASVPDMRAFLAEAAQKERDIAPFVGVKDATGLALILGMDDPFALDDSAMESVSVETAIVHEAYEADDMEGGVADAAVSVSGDDTGHV